MPQNPSPNPKADRTEASVSQLLTWVDSVPDLETDDDHSVSMSTLEDLHGIYKCLDLMERVWPTEENSIRVGPYQLEKEIGRGGMGMMGHYLGYYVGQMAFGFLATLIVRYFSRRREFRADVGGAELAGRQQMISALEKLKGGHEAPLPENLKAFAISGGALKSGLRALTSTHPKLDDRIMALRDAG